MERIQLNAEVRTLGSKGRLNQMRLAGKVPGVLHAHGGESLLLTVSAAELKKVISSTAGMNVLLNLEIEGLGTQIAMVELLERDFRKPGAYTHVNFTRISMDTKIEARVPVVLSGQEKRSSTIGVVSLLTHELLVLTSPGAIPEHFTVDVGTMATGATVCIKDIPMPEGCSAMGDPDELVLHVVASRVVEEAPVV